MNRRNFLKQSAVASASILFGSAFGAGVSTSNEAMQLRIGKKRPNIVYILADDMGIDSVSALNAKSGIATPNINKLISQGMTFTDAHSGSAVCSPTRYGVLTGRYSWRVTMGT